MSIKTRIVALTLAALVATGSVACTAASAEARDYHGELASMMARAGAAAPITTASIMIAIIIAVTAIAAGRGASTSTATTSAVFAAVATDRSDPR
jgi:hypothetical protein